MVTIETTSALPIGDVASLMARLEELGVTKYHLARALSNPGLTLGLAAMLVEEPQLPKRLVKGACSALIDRLLPKKLDEMDGSCRSSDDSDALYTDEREWLSEPAQIQLLLLELTPVQLAVIVKRSGLNGQPVQDAEAVGTLLNLRTNKVNRIRGQASKAMKSKALEMVMERRRHAASRL